MVSRPAFVLLLLVLQLLYATSVQTSVDRKLLAVSTIGTSASSQQGTDNSTNLNRSRQPMNTPPKDPAPPPWELQLAPFLTDLSPRRDANTTVLRGPPHLVGSYKGNWLKSSYGAALQPADLLSADRGVVVLHLAEVEGDEPPGEAARRGGQEAAGAVGPWGAMPGGVREIKGDLILRDGPRVTDSDIRFRLRGTYVPAAGTVHAVLEPLLPVREELDPEEQGAAGAAAGPGVAPPGRGGGDGTGAAGAAGPGQGTGAMGGSYREALRTAARQLITFGPAWHRMLVRGGPPPPPPWRPQSRRAAMTKGAVAAGELASPPPSPPSPPSPSPPPRKPLQLALVKTCEFRAHFRVYYKGDPDAKSHVQFLRLDEPAPPPLPPPPPSSRRSRRPPPTSSVDNGTTAQPSTAAAGGASAAATSGDLPRLRRRLAADTEIYHSTQMQLHGDGDVFALGGGGGSADGSDDAGGEDSVYGIPAGMDPRDPDLELVGLVMSPNCDLSVGFNASSVHLERYFRQAVRYSALVAAVTIGQIVLSVGQSEASSSPSAAARMSLYCITLQAIMDAYQCLLHLTGALVVDALFGAFASVAFLQFLLFAVFEMRQTLLVWRAQRTNGTGTGGDFWTVRRDMSAVYTRFYAMLLMGLLLMFQLQSHLEVLVVLLHSWWLPQVVHSARSDTRPPLKMDYVWGMSALRLISPLYFYGCPSNLLRIAHRPGVCVVLVAWVGLQAALVTAQTRWGPRACIPRALLPRRYDYHRPASKREMGMGEDPGAGAQGRASGAAGAASATNAAPAASSTLGGRSRAMLSRLAAWLPSSTWFRRTAGAAAAAGATAAGVSGGHRPGGSGGGAGDGDVETGHGSKECVICMNPVPLLPLTSRMLTPCGHFFHEPCLTRWMEVKMDCPTCRRPLPPA